MKGAVPTEHIGPATRSPLRRRPVRPCATVRRHLLTVIPKSTRAIWKEAKALLGELAPNVFLVSKVWPTQFARLL